MGSSADQSHWPCHDLSPAVQSHLPGLGDPLSRLRQLQGSQDQERQRVSLEEFELILLILFKVCEVDDVLDCLRPLHCSRDLHRLLLCLVSCCLLTFSDYPWWPGGSLSTMRWRSLSWYTCSRHTHMALPSFIASLSTQHLFKGERERQKEIFLEFRISVQ